MIHRDVNPAEDANVHADGNADADLRMAECNLAFFCFHFCSDSLARTCLGSTTRETRHPPSLTLYQSAFHPSSTTLRARLKTLLLQTFGYFKHMCTSSKLMIRSLLVIVLMLTLIMMLRRRKMRLKVSTSLLRTWTASK